MHWALPPAAVRPLVPAALDLDLAGGQAYVSLIPFAIPESRPVLLPRALSMGFLELNCRTYVRGPDGRAGVYFWSLDASSLLAVAGARIAYGLPYYPAAMSARTEATPGGGARVRYASARRLGPPACLRAAWWIGESIGTAAPGTLDHFLVERYALYVERRSWPIGRPVEPRPVMRVVVRHPPYPLRAVELEALEETVLGAAGVPARGRPSVVHFSSGVDVEIFFPEVVRR